MSQEEAHTEERIKEKARILFFQKGLLNATTQEIADEAGVNRALIHYYFRSREQMLETILNETLLLKKARVQSILSSDRPFRERIASYIDAVVDLGLTYPYLDNFIISEAAKNPDMIRNFCAKEPVKSSDLIRKDLNAEIKKGTIAPISAEHFMVNLSAMCNYPLLAKPVLKAIHGMTETSYRKFLQERKQIIFMTIFNEEMPDVSSKTK
jgi:AcrR family transcriptional regulator